MSRKSLRRDDYLGHILKAIERVERYTSSISFEDFSRNEMAQDAVIRNLEIIGEACRNIAESDPAFAGRHPDFPLGAAVGMRNILAHGYFGVELDIVWNAVRANLPKLQRQCRQILAERPGN